MIENLIIKCLPWLDVGQVPFWFLKYLAKSCWHQSSFLSTSSFFFKRISWMYWQLKTRINNNKIILVAQINNIIQILYDISNTEKCNEGCQKYRFLNISNVNQYFSPWSKPQSAQQSGWPKWGPPLERGRTASLMRERRKERPRRTLVRGHARKQHRKFEVNFLEDSRLTFNQAWRRNFNCPSDSS